MTDAKDIAELEFIQRELEKRRKKGDVLAYSPQKPFAKQAEFLALNCFEALYGGAAGGGKSSCLLMAALQYVHVPGYAALILRRTYADLALPGAIMDRAKALLIPQGVAWNDKDKRFTFPSGSTLTFGYLDSDRDRFRYQGAELQFIGFDELTQFPEQWYRYLLSRLRRLKTSEVPIRVRAASNPGGVGHEWVKRRFIDNPESRVFIPSTLDDNPYIDKVEYTKSLDELDAATARQLRDGIWIRDTAGLVYQYDKGRNAITSKPELEYYLIGIDYGYTDDCAYTVCGWSQYDPTVYICESYKRGKQTPSDSAEEVRSLLARFEANGAVVVQIVGDTGGLGKGYAEEARKRFALPIESAEKRNKRGYISLMNGDLEKGRVKVFSPLCEELTKEWSELPWLEDRSAESPGFDNHCADSALYAWRACTAWPNRALVKPPAYGSSEWFKNEESRMLESDEESHEKRLREDIYYE